MPIKTHLDFIIESKHKHHFLISVGTITWFVLCKEVNTVVWELLPITVAGLYLADKLLSKITKYDYWDDNAPND
jgi:hypothetical protein